MDYYKCCSEFSDDAMHLNDLEEAVKGKFKISVITFYI